jgi:hypothetical protein
VIAYKQFYVVNLPYTLAFNFFFEFVPDIGAIRIEITSTTPFDQKSVGDLVHTLY